MSAPVTVQRVFTASAERIWQALTMPDLMKQWYFDLPGFKAEVGYSFEFVGGPPEKEYRHICRVTEVKQNARLAYTWRYDGYAGCSTVLFELLPQDGGTLVRVTHTDLDTFPQDNPHLLAHNFQAGWDDIIVRSLAGFLDE